ncbi:putative transcription factor interactor and regulator CCHC(Zn) family [Helianthus annuus]|uniref:Transcription factor interactor and regulator CCHC(Zn) family n=1 Tax=Helianthus annuus TaxID=4232 RepID=A0A9K3NRD0_HELAN|nr:putative transcription factor interactor and regulator CCHC(Zn) family [Helianthus annuus]KAJ0931412.1 putative transcription factor interactor and regulator CCHC(Zn) family [Helianthus annuus]
MKNGTVQKKETRTCFQCKTIGHIDRKCPKAIQSKQGVSLKMKEKMVEDESPIKPFIVFKNSKFEVGECSKRFYKRKANLDNQKWVVKRSDDSSSNDSDSSKSEELSSGDESDSTKSEEPQIEPRVEKLVSPMDDANFPPLRAENFKQKVRKVEISNQFFSEKKEFDVEKAFNPTVHNIFGKMIDGKVKGVKEFYENKKGKKPSVDNSDSPKDCQAWENLFN